MKRTRQDVAFDTLNVFFMTLLAIVMLYPLYFVVIASLASPYEVAAGSLKLWPKELTLDAYMYVLQENKIWRGYGNTIVYTTLGTLFNLALTIPAAYTLSKKHIPLHSFISWYFLIPMWFGGGLIPTYIMYKKIGLLNKAFTMIVMGGIGIYNVVVSRVYFETSIPGELYDAARVDGANDFYMFFRIALPLSTPILAVIALYYAVGRWNDYFTALIYLSDQKYYPLQMVLRSILIKNENILNVMTEKGDMSRYAAEIHYQKLLAASIKYAVIFIASAPLLIAYPFVQKYFVKGVMIGSLKG